MDVRRSRRKALHAPPTGPFDFGSGRALLRVSFMLAPSFANSPAALGGATNGFLPGPLEAEIRAIYRRSPLYGTRFPLHAEPLQWPCYREIPVLSKREIV